MQPVGIYFRVMAHHVGKRRQATVVHIGRGARHVAQRRHLEFTEIPVLLGHLPRFDRARAIALVVVAAEQVERVRLQLPDTHVAPGIDAARHEEGHPGVVEFTVGEGGADVAGATVAPADENAQAALCGFWIFFHRRKITAR